MERLLSKLSYTETLLSLKANLILNSYDLFITVTITLENSNLAEMVSDLFPNQITNRSVEKDRKLRESVGRTFTFSHLADILIQSDLQ